MHSTIIVANTAFFGVTNVVDLAILYYREKYERQKKNFVNIEDAFVRNNNGEDFYDDMLRGSLFGKKILF